MRIVIWDRVGSQAATMLHDHTDDLIASGVIINIPLSIAATSKHDYYQCTKHPTR